MLSESERLELALGIRQAAQEYSRSTGIDTEDLIDHRHAEHDGHLIFEALHILANGNPERLFSMLHKHSIKNHPEANPGRTYLLIRKIAEFGVAGAEEFTGLGFQAA